MSGRPPSREQVEAWLADYFAAGVAEDVDVDPEAERFALDAVADLWEDEIPHAPAPPPRARPSWRSRAAASVVALAAAAAIVLMVAVPPAQGPERSVLQPKGASFSLHVAVQREDGPVARVADGDALQAGDRLGFFYTAARDGHVAILYGDPTGEFVFLHPFDGHGTVPAAAGAEVRLDAGAQLTDARGCEWIVAFFAPEPRRAEALLNEARRMYRDRRGCTLAPSEDPELTVDVLGVRRP